jgi:hypothetical protein
LFPLNASQGARVLASTCAAVLLLAAPQSAGSTGAAPAAPSAPTPKWVEIHRGSLHSIYADIGAADWSLPTVRTKILLYQRQGVLGPGRNGHFRLETAIVNCQAYTRTVTHSSVMDANLARLQEADRLLERQGGEPAPVWREALMGLCGMSPPSARQALTDAEVRQLGSQPTGQASATPGASDFDTAVLQAAGAAAVPVVYARGTWWRAREGDCGRDSSGSRVQLAGGSWVQQTGACAESEFMREIRLLDLLDGYAMPTVELAAERIKRDMPLLPRPASVPPVTQ